ncbi:MAG: hypothetical protein K0Q67_417, partial [Cellvibrio sp.]|nr:hypothetical protein [Cellvibrio sp.]
MAIQSSITSNSVTGKENSKVEDISLAEAIAQFKEA